MLERIPWSDFLVSLLASGGYFSASSPEVSPTTRPFPAFPLDTSQVTQPRYIIQTHQRGIPEEMSANGILKAVFGGVMVKMLSREGALDALSSAMWSTMRVTLLVCLICGLALLFTKTINGMSRAEPEIVLRKLLTSSRGLRFFWDHLKYQMYGTQPPTRKYNGESIGTPVAFSFGSVFVLFRVGLEWILTWLPSGEVGGHFDKLPDRIQDRRASSSGSAKKGKKQTVPSKIQQSVGAPATGGKMKKRHSMPSLQTAPAVKTVVLPVVQEDLEDEGFVPVKRDRSSTAAREDEPEPVGPPQDSFIDAVSVKARRSHSRDETKLEQGSGTALPAAISSAALSMLDVSESLGEVESRFAKYFHSTAATDATRGASISSSSGDSVTSSSTVSMGPRDNVYRPPALAIAKSRPSLDPTEKRLVDGDLTPPPGFGRRTKSVVPLCTAPVSPATVNPNTTSSTAYRRPTGTFASKGYALTSESVFAARASPINPTAPPLETRTQSFFQQRLSVSRGSSPAPVASQKSATPEPQSRAPIRRSSAAVEEKTIFEPVGQRRSLFPRTWSPWTEEDSLVPPGAHLKPVGIIGSRPSSSNSPSEEDKHTPEPLAEPFSLFNMDLFSRTSSS